MSYEDALAHRAIPVGTVTAGNWIEGDPDEEEDAGTGFDCALFLPMGGEQNPPRGRRAVRTPTLLLAPLDDRGELVTVSPEDQLDITAPEITGPSALRWQVNGFPQPFGPPGEPIIGSQVTLVRVED